ncbi:WD40 repeat isoform A [Chlorella sorokiniana]|uniref:WD40 repeat isoform A n=1 Tax=Chlorella sorokiniana TaxID=3076 RepID=A0A2P6TNB8_CHLSO|nr:WD40 repeat isoform A [Chlorella sorokiniana]|eukprot:PRW50831.1 WD40 repeat isoform A [Chlorella sorokiniana]
MGLAGGTEPPRKGDAGGLCNYSSTYDRGATIQHWQLRDLVHCPSKDEELFCVYRHRTLRHDLASGKTEVVQELPFEPTSMTVAHGYVAAGGQNSQLDARRLGGGEVVYKGHCGGSVNNALHIGRDASQQLRLFVCNNDDTIKVYGLQGGALATVLRCPVAINYCALSPSGRHLVCVGDNRHTYLYQATPAAYRQCGVFTEACDAGMCCAWSASGSMFASASQDGSVAVWDHRSSALVAHFLTPLACRNVKFSPAPLDLLAFAEHRSRCHLVDCRMWDRQQVLDVGGQDCEPDISGIAFSPSGRRLYVGTEGGLAAYDIDTMGRRGFPTYELC